MAVDGGAVCHLIFADRNRGTHNLDKSTCQTRRRSRLILLELQYGEFIAANTRNQVRLAQCTTQALSNYLKQFVAALMAQGIIDGLAVCPQTADLCRQ
jgi:hypothetical protein